MISVLRVETSCFSDDIETFLYSASTTGEIIYTRNYKSDKTYGETGARLTGIRVESSAVLQRQSQLTAYNYR